MLFYLLMPFTIRQYGAPGAFIFMAVVAVAGAFFMPWFPKRRQTVVEAAKLSLTAIPAFGLLATAALATMWLGHNAVWTFVERIGVHAGFSSIAIAAVLSVAAFLTVGGPALAHAFDTRFGFGAPMILAIILKTAVIFLLVYRHPSRCSP